MSEPNLVSPRKYLLTFVALITLLGVTFLLAHLDLGSIGTAAGLLIAATKALLVALYFMHIRGSSGIHRVVAGVGAFWLGVLIVLCLTDYLSRGWLLLPSPWPQ